MTAAMIPRLANTASSRDVVDALTEMGAVIVERLVSEELIDNVMAELTPFIDATPYGSDSFSGRTTRRTGSLLARSMLSHELIGHLLILDAAKQYLWGQKETFQLHLTQAITIEPGGPAQLMHRDQWCFDHFPFPDDVNVEMSTIWAMCDFTEDIGATRVIPGSHREADSAMYDVERSVPAVMPKGSVVIYGGRTIHGGGANVTNDIRTGLNADYVLGWLRQEENQYLSAPPEVASTFSERMQRLAGYQMGAYALGYYGDVLNPLDLVRPDRERGGGHTFGLN